MDLFNAPSSSYILYTTYCTGRYGVNTPTPTAQRAGFGPRVGHIFLPTTNLCLKPCCSFNL